MKPIETRGWCGLDDEFRPKLEDSTCSVFNTPSVQFPRGAARPRLRRCCRLDMSIAPSTRASVKSGGAQSTTGKLNALADNFNHFYGDLEEETTIRKQAEEARVVRIEKECGKIERVIATETKRRIEASKALQAMFETQLVKIQKEFKEDLRETYEPLQEQIDALIGRVERLEKTMEVRFGNSSTS